MWRLGSGVGMEKRRVVKPAETSAERGGGRGYKRKVKAKGKAKLNGKSKSKRSRTGYSYANGGDWAEREWREVFYRALCERLLRFKRRWDPEGWFGCWKFVGWNEDEGEREGDMRNKGGEGEEGEEDEGGWKRRVEKKGGVGACLSCPLFGYVVSSRFFFIGEGLWWCGVNLWR